MIPSTVLQCSFCGRVRIDGGDWTRDPLVQVTAVGWCKDCGDWRDRVMAAKAAKALREVDRHKAQGYGPAPEGSDPFMGMRDVTE